MESPSLGRLTEVLYVCDFGVGHVLLAGELPIALELPGPERRVPAAGRRRTHWADDLERYFAGEAVAFKLDIDA